MSKFMRKNLLGLCTIFFIFISLMACSALLFIEPKGNVNANVIFTFYESMNFANPQKVKLFSLCVQEQIKGNEWQSIWEIAGKAKINAIQYGLNPKGSLTIVDPKKFRIGGRYRVIATASIGFKPVSNVKSHFYFAENGDLVMEERWGNGVIH